MTHLPSTTVSPQDGRKRSEISPRKVSQKEQRKSLKAVAKLMEMNQEVSSTPRRTSGRASRATAGQSGHHRERHALYHHGPCQSSRK